MTTLPGVVSNNNSQFRLVFNQTNDFYVNGMRGTANNFFLDGVINTDVGANDGEYTELSIDAVGEFKTLTGNFNAEYGRSPGVMILVNTKAGGDRFHGTAWEFDRNTDFDARDWFTAHSGGATPVLKFNQFGGNIGGYIPIPKISPRSNKKAFFFFNYEGTRSNKPNGNPGGAAATFYTMPLPSMLGIGTPNGEANLAPVYRPGNHVRFQWHAEHLHSDSRYPREPGTERAGFRAGNSQIQLFRRGSNRHALPGQHHSSIAIQLSVSGNDQVLHSGL